MHGPDAAEFRLALARARADIVAAVHAWREKGGSDDDLALIVDGRKPGKPSVSTSTREALKLTIPDFEPTIAIEFARHLSGHVPAVVDLPDLVRRVVWIDLTEPYSR